MSHKAPNDLGISHATKPALLPPSGPPKDPLRPTTRVEGPLVSFRLGELRVFKSQWKCTPIWRIGETSAVDFLCSIMLSPLTFIQAITHD